MPTTGTITIVPGATTGLITITGTSGGGGTPVLGTPGAFLINGVDVSTLGFALSSAVGWTDSPPRTLPNVIRPRRAGAYPTGPAQEGVRKLSLNGVVDALTWESARSQLDALKALILSAQPTTIQFPDFPTRYVRGYWDGYIGDANQASSMITRTLKSRIDFTLLDPYSYDIAAITAALSAAPSRVLLGTAPSYPVITITGASTNPVLSFYRYDGVLLASMALTLTTVGGDTLVIDMDAQTILKNGATQIAALSAGDFFALTPATAQNGLGAASGDRGYLTLSSGAGNAVYRPAWV